MSIVSRYGRKLRDVAYHVKDHRRLSESQLGVLLTLPSLLIIAALIIFPLLYSWYLGFFQTSGLTMELEFAGLQNYVRLFNTNEFWVTLKNNIYWTFGTLSIQILLGVAIALLLNRDFWGRNIVRGAVLFPYMVPTIVAVFNFHWIFNATYGVFNYILVTLGVLSESISFFSRELAMETAIMLGVWRFTPFVIITVLARLQTIPPSLYEAAKLDGAYKVAQFRYVTWPQIYNILVIVVLLRGVWMFYKFAPIYLLTRGGPGISTQILPIYAYIQAFRGLNFGYGAAIANVMFVILIISGFLYLHKYHKTEGVRVEA